MSLLPDSTSGSLGHVLASFWSLLDRRGLNIFGLSFCSFGEKWFNEMEEGYFLCWFYWHNAVAEPVEHQPTIWWTNQIDFLEKEGYIFVFFIWEILWTFLTALNFYLCIGGKEVLYFYHYQKSSIFVKNFQCSDFFSNFSIRYKILEVDF